jgi:tRNA nucleotidyltransferase/poly(A) polymerase
MENKVLKTPLETDITYSDDPLRMMRAIRFANQLNFEIENNSLESITKNAERIKIFLESNCRRTKQKSFQQTNLLLGSYYYIKQDFLIYFYLNWL